MKVKIVSFGIIAIMMMVAILSVVPPGVQALPEIGTNSAIDTGDSIMLFNYTFEEETVNTRPDFGHFENLGANLVMQAKAVAGHGLALNVNRTGPDAGTYRGGFAIGHTLSEFTVEFDYNKIRQSGHQNSRPSFRLCPTSAAAGYVFLITGYQTYLDFGGGVTHNINSSQWYHVKIDVSIASGSASISVDGVSVGSSALLATTPVAYWQFVSPSMTLADHYSEYYIDNIAFSIAEKEVMAYPSTNLNERTAVSFTFDDVQESVYLNGTTVFGSYPAAIALITNAVGTGIYMNWSQAQELADLGWEIMSHSVTHPTFPSITEAQQRTELANSKRAIEENLTGVTVKGFVYPGNANNDATDEVAWEYYDYITSSQDIQRNSGYQTSDTIYTRAVLNKFLPATIYGKYGYIDIYSHGITDTPGSYDSHIDVLTQFVTKLRANNSEVYTPSQYYEQFRNYKCADITGNTTRFSISYPTGYSSFSEDEVIVRLETTMENGDYVAVSGYIVIEFDYDDLADDGIVLNLTDGVWEIYTLSDWRQMQFEDSVAPIFAIIPLVVIVAVIPLVMGLGKKIKL